MNRKSIYQAANMNGSNNSLHKRAVSLVDQKGAKRSQKMSHSGTELAQLRSFQMEVSVRLSRWTPDGRAWVTEGVGEPKIYNLGAEVGNMEASVDDRLH